MNAQTVIELIGLVAGSGGGVQLITKLTRMAVAVETLVDANRKVAETVTDHERRLLKGGL